MGFLLGLETGFLAQKPVGFVLTIINIIVNTFAKTTPGNQAITRLFAAWFPFSNFFHALLEQISVQVKIAQPAADRAATVRKCSDGHEQYRFRWLREFIQIASLSVHREIGSPLEAVDSPQYMPTRAFYRAWLDRMQLVQTGNGSSHPQIIHARPLMREIFSLMFFCFTPHPSN
jgi:hypothetical protein